MNILRKFVKFCLALHILLITSCSTIESTLDSTWDSISEAEEEDNSSTMNMIVIAVIALVGGFAYISYRSRRS